MKIYKATDKGLIRKTNQDSCDGGILNDGTVWAVVCDGMGGRNGGDIASKIAVKEIKKHLESSYREDMTSTSIRDMLNYAIYYANYAIFSKAKENPEIRGMGTTAVLSLIVKNCLYTVNVGDSRAYIIMGDTIQQITTDHSMVQEMLSKGLLTREEAQNHPQKNIITRVLGIDKYVDVDYYEEPFKQGDVLLLCSDGLTNYISEEAILSMINKIPYEHLPEKYIKTANENGGGDNITVIIITGNKAKEA